jgi:long-chain acyl-CoA synthetase
MKHVADQPETGVAARATGEPPAESASMLALAQRGMLLSHWAVVRGDAPALLSRRGNRSFAQLNANANRLLHRLRAAGLTGDEGLAVVLGNVPQFVEAWLACQRGGLRFTPVNWHLAPAEVAYVLGDCGAAAWIVDADFAELVGPEAERPRVALAVGGSISGFVDYAAALSEGDPADPEAPSLGRTMLYTSGTTGRPKGVLRSAGWVLPPQREGTIAGYRDGDVALLCGPAYHGGPLTFDIAMPLASGATVLMMEKFDPEQWLALVERYCVTHCHLVATMFQRLLALPAATRGRYDLSSLRLITHGAAPTPPDVKRAMIDWLGPILFEYYAATEASPNIRIGSEEWLRKPGSVGRVPPGGGTCVLDESGEPSPPGVVGRICFRPPEAMHARYFNAPDKNRAMFEREYFTVGDLGYVDEDGFLFLTGRSAETIISGGVNIYPQEVDNALLAHPAVRESCTVGVPDPEWGEAVRGVVTLAEGHAPSDTLGEELRVFAARSLARFKVPRQIDFVGEIPHSEAGKVLRGAVRATYWAGHEREI